jgi:hypothetical protein
MIRKPGNLLLVTACLLASCASVPQFPQPNSLWESFSGQLQYVTPERSLVGEFVASRHAQDFQLEFSKGGAVPLMKLARHGAFARAEGPFARGRWQGEAVNAPEALRGWVVEVPRVFASLEPTMRLTANLPRVRVDVDRGRPRRIEIPGGTPGEKFVFIFAH